MPKSLAGGLLGLPHPSFAIPGANLQSPGLVRKLLMNKIAALTQSVKKILRQDFDFPSLAEQSPWQMRADFTADKLLIEIDSEREMDELASLIAPLLEPGDVICLDGSLGAGKTRLVRAIASVLGCEREWAGSPTFILVQEYEGRLPIYHMDAYRLKDSQEFREMGGEDYFWGDGLCLVEWSKRIADVLPADVLQIDIEVLSPTARRLCLSSRRSRSTALMQQIAKQLGTNTL